MLALGVTNAWGAEATLSSISTKNVVTTKGQSVSTTFGDVTCKVTRNSGNQPGFYTSSGIVRYYSGDVMTLSVPSGNTITKVVFTMNSGNVGNVDVGTVSSNTWTGNAESISFTGTATVKITKIVVTYETTSGGQTPEPDPDPTPDPEPDPEEPGTGGEALSYTWDLSKKTYSAASNTQVTWSATDVNMVADKGTAGTAPNNYLGGDANNRTSSRFYQNSILTITPEANVTITSVVFTATSTNYATALKGSTWTNATASANNTTVTVTPTDGTTAISAKIGGTCGFTGVTVNYTKTSSGSGETVVSVPTFTPESGTTFTESLEVTLSAESGCDIYYTTDDTEPTTSSTKYTSSIKLTESKTIKAIANNGTKSSAVATATYTKVDPTGTFTLHTGDLIEGDYVIVSTNALANTVNKERIASLPVTISNNTITDPSVAVIWHIAKSGDYWTLYNENAKKYAASTGVKNKAALLDADEDGKALWSVSGTETYEFINKKNTENSINANLRYNSGNDENSRWACYSTSTGGALSLYRKAGAKYNVTVNSTTNGTVTADPTSAEAGTTITLTVTPEAGYVLDALTVTDASSNTVTVTNNEFTMPASDVTVTATFKLNEKPAATLTLSKNGVEETFPGSWKQDDVVTLPSITSDCVKEFVGWSANPTCNVAPEYAAGDSYTLTATAQTLYAVYATVEGGEATASVDMATYANDNSWGSSSSTNQKEININSDLKAVISEGGNSGKYYNDGVRIYQTEDATVTVSTTAGELKSVKFTFTIANNGTLLHEGVAMTSDEAVEVSGNSAVFTVGDTHATENKGQVRFTAIEVVYTGGATYSNYSTTCSAALANPTFSLAEGKYTEVKSVTISAAEGTIYYTMDGTTPTASSTQYTGAIALNDCGEYTIKAIAISADSQSDVVSATYTIKLPLTNSEAAPYTETEAVEVYNGGCYDNQDVYVKGTVKTATFYNSGTYTITLTNGFQFYKFYKDGSKTLFADGEINKGDVLVACGKLSKYNTTYQLAEGCYLVKHEPYTEPKTDISNTEATAYTVDQAFALIADVSSDLSKTVYVKGLVAVAPTSNPTADGQMTYKISDNGKDEGDVLTVYLGLGIDGAQFTSKNDVQQGDYVIVKGQLYDFNGTYELNKGNQLVQHLKAATITIADITMEVGETKTIAATITPDAAKTEVTYSIKAGSDDCITLSENNITAKAEGTATIVATIATAAEYMGKTVEFTVTVTPESTSDEVVILAEHNGQWYALKAEDLNSDKKVLAALAVTYLNGKLYNVNETDKASITWTRTIVGDQVTFKNGTNYLYVANPSKTELSLNATAFSWTYDAVLDTYTSNNGARTFLYSSEATGFKNFAINNNVGTKNYSGYPVVTAPVYDTAIEIGSGDNSTVIAPNQGQIVNVIVERAFEAGDEWYTLCVPFNMSASLIGTAYQLSGLIQKDADYVEVNLAPKTTIEAGKPYLVKPNVTVNKFVVENVTIVNTTGESIAKSIEGLSVEMQGVINGSGTTGVLYWVGNSGYLYNDDVAKLGLRTYFNITTPSGIAPRMRVVAGENVETGVEDLFTTDAPVKVIENGQLIIIRDGVKYNVQGQVIK